MVICFSSSSFLFLSPLRIHYTQYTHLQAFLLASNPFHAFSNIGVALHTLISQLRRSLSNMPSFISAATVLATFAFSAVSVSAFDAAAGDNLAVYWVRGPLY